MGKDQAMVVAMRLAKKGYQVLITSLSK